MIMSIYVTVIQTLNSTVQELVQKTKCQIDLSDTAVTLKFDPSLRNCKQTYTSMEVFTMQHLKDPT